MAQLWEKNSLTLAKLGKVFCFKFGFSCYLGMFQVKCEYFQPVGKEFSTGNPT